MKLLQRSSRRAAKALEAAEALEADGHHLEALDMLTAANREARSAEIEARLVQTRYRAFAELGDPDSGLVEGSPVEPGTKPEDGGLPVIDAERLDAASVRGAILSHGCVIVRGLVDPGRAAELCTAIDRTFEAREAHVDGAPGEETAPWYDPFVPDDEEVAAAVNVGRGFIGEGSGIYTADSPRTMFELFEAFQQRGVNELVSAYLGERPAVSVAKGTLRRAQPTVGTEWWHQDASFLDEDIRALNIWLSLTASGVDAPGLEVVPKRFEQIVECGTKGAQFEWSVGEPVIEEVSGGTLSRPVFEPGDAMVFDHLFLHRTGSDASMTKTRYATETWFFAPSAYPSPEAQVPLAY